jgi:hypothetical protein
MSYPPAATAVAEPPSLESLSLRWRRQVDLVTDLAVRRHSLDASDPRLSSLVDGLDRQLSTARQSLADIEAELQRLDPPGKRRWGW